MGCRYAGIDWASEKHDVLVADQSGAELLTATYAHDEKGLTALCRALVRLEVGLVAIERPDGLLVERLLDAGLRVMALHPNKVAAARDRFRVSGGKSDRFDAFVLCELARTDSHRFRVLEPDCDQTKALRAMTRAREGLVATRTGVMNQLRAASRRPDLPVAVQIARERDHGRGAAGRDRRLPRALPHPGRARRRRRPRRRCQGVRQAENRQLPVGLQQAPTGRVLSPGGQQPPLAPLGPGPLRPSAAARPRTPSSDPHPRTRLVSRGVAMLAQPHPIRPRATPRAATPHHSHHPRPVGPNARPHCHPADGRRHCHPTGGPHGPSAKRLTASRHPLPKPGG
jgi:hypothetical protein